MVLGVVGGRGVVGGWGGVPGRRGAMLLLLGDCGVATCFTVNATQDVPTRKGPVASLVEKMRGYLRIIMSELSLLIPV